MLKDRIESETKFVDIYKIKKGLSEDDKTVKILRRDIDNLRIQLEDIDSNDNENLPHIPMGSNTHTKSKDNFVYGKTKIKLNPAVKDNIHHMLLVDRARSIWNALPDDVRDLVGELRIQKGRGGRSWNNGKWNRLTKQLTLNINDKSKNIEHTVYHEIGHARWYDKKEKDIEKVNKFSEEIKKIGISLTAYSESYRKYKWTNRNNEDNYRLKMRRAGLQVPEEAEKILKDNRDRADTLYQNECHSEINSYVMGHTPNTRIVASEEQTKRLLIAYKELWNLG